jgi:mRNA interferase RelE/StbE
LALITPVSIPCHSLQTLSGIDKMYSNMYTYYRALRMAYEIEITPTALEGLEAISDRRTCAAIIRRIDSLAEEPEKLGKPLRGWLVGFMSVRAAGQRYRIVYRVDNATKKVLVYMVGIRKEGSQRDIYTLAEHLVRRGLI